MRLLNVGTKQLKDFMGDDNIPEYAILSHTWGEDEVTFDGLLDLFVKSKLGYTKIDYCCQQALEDGLEWVWIDTCCIDKSSSAELSEAINSMFRWYQNAVCCYVYLSDYFQSTGSDEVGNASGFANCRWFTRGWTLQELLAPKTVLFYSRTWIYLGSKDTLCKTLSEITGIERETLEGEALNRTSIARRMYWAAGRVTTRTEDLAYCLLGIFDVNMPLLYGEGEKAFFRLQEEIIKSSSDQSLFAWGGSTLLTMETYLHQKDFLNSDLRGLLAESPDDFENSGFIDSLNHWELERGGWDPKPTTIHNKTIHVHLPVVKSTHPNIECTFAVLGCRKRERYAIDNSNYIAIPLLLLDTGMFVRYNKLILIPKAGHLYNSEAIKSKTQHLSLAISSKMRWDFDLLEQHSARYFLRPKIPSSGTTVYLSHVHCNATTNYDRQTGMVWSDQSFGSIAAYFLFKCHTQESSFAVVISGTSVWALRPTGDKGPDLIDRIYVHAKIHHHAYDPCGDLSPSSFEGIVRDNSGWKRMMGPDASVAPQSDRKPTGRYMELALSDYTKAVITTQWITWQDRWHEDLTIDIVKNFSLQNKVAKTTEGENSLKRKAADLAPKGGLLERLTLKKRS